jgi:NADPH:quinone reductase-like Zn-dependent oxidoreductase
MTLPSTMRAAVAQRPGAPELLQLLDLPVPAPGSGQMLLRVESASINFSDIKRRRGDVYPFPTRFPYVPGAEVAGHVAALGPGVDGPAVGTPVFALVGGDGHGGCAQFALAYAPQVVPRPPGLDADRASGLLVAGTTALLLLRQAGRLQPGESVLVPAATGAVGSWLVQLALQAGAAQVIAATSSAAKADKALSLGAHAVVDYAQPDWSGRVRALTGGRGVDLLFEASGGPVLAEGLRALAPFGRAVVYGAASGHDALLDTDTLRRLLYAPADNHSLVAFNLGGWFMQRPQVAGGAMAELIGLVSAGTLAVPAIETLPLREAATAHRRIEQRATSGKIVLKPWQH